MEALNVDLQLHALLQRLRENRTPGSREDCLHAATVYSGCLGRCYACLHVCWALQRAIDCDCHSNSKTTANAQASAQGINEKEGREEMLLAWKGELLDLATQYLHGSTRAKLSKEAEVKPSFLCGNIVGRNVMTALVESEKIRMSKSTCANKVTTQTASHRRIETAVEQITSLEAEILENSHAGVHGIMNGTSGWLHALLLMRSSVVSGKRLVPIEMIERVSLYLVDQGQNYTQSMIQASENKSDGGAVESLVRMPLQFKWEDKMHLGAAHGLCGIVVVILDAMDAMRHVGASIFESTLKHLDVTVRLTVSYILELRLPSGNLRKCPNRDTDKLVQWCHGAVGMGIMLVRCAETLGGSFRPLSRDCDRFLDRSGFLIEADRAASLLLKTKSWKGPGLCHGASGAAYLFLLLYNLTGRQEYLNETRGIVDMIMSWDEGDLLQRNDRPYSLFEGISGAICLVSDLKAVESRKGFFPGFGLPRQHN